MTAIFDINAPSNTIFLNADRRGEGIVVLTNTTDRRVQGRVLIETDNPALKQAVTIVDAERIFLPNETQQFTLRVEAPPTLKGGMYRFRIATLDVDAPDDHYQQGSSILFIAPPPANAAFTAAAIAAAIIGLFVVVGVVVGLVLFIANFEQDDGINSQLAYTTVIDGQQVIRLYDLGEQSEAQIIPTPPADTDEHSPVWSPEGRRLAFISNRAGQVVNDELQRQWSIYILSFQPLLVRRVDDDISNVTQVIWSPDGERLAYVRRNSATDYQIIQIEANGDSPVTVYRSSQPIYSLSYYPDGRGMTFVQDFLVKFLLFGETEPQNLMDAAFQQQTFGLLLEAQWSPGGDVLAVSALNDPTTRRVASIFRLDFASPQTDDAPIVVDDTLIRLTFGHNDRNPIWSLDGRRIVFISTTRSREGYLPRPYQILARAEQAATPLDVPASLAIFQPDLQPRFDQEIEPTASPTVTHTPTPTPSSTPTAVPAA